MTATAASLGQIRRVIVPVTDQDRALTFYRDTLGFALVADVPFAGGQRWIELAPPGGSTSVALSPPMASAVGVATGISFSTSDADAAHADMAARGVDVDPAVIRLDGAPPMFFFRDADANILHVAEE